MKRFEEDPTPSTPRNFRVAARMTARDVAVRMGVAPSVVSRLERQRANPTTGTLAAFFAAVGRDDLEDLFRNGSRHGVARVSFRDLRLAAGLTSIRTAELMGDCRTAPSRIENGFGYVTSAVLARYFAAVGRDDLAAVLTPVLGPAEYSAVQDVQRQPGRLVVVAGPLSNSGGCIGPLTGAESLPVAPGSEPVQPFGEFFEAMCELSGDDRTGTSPRVLFRAYRDWLRAHHPKHVVRERETLAVVATWQGVRTVRIGAGYQRAFNIVLRQP